MVVDEKAKEVDALRQNLNDAIKVSLACGTLFKGTHVLYTCVQKKLVLIYLALLSIKTIEKVLVVFFNGR